MSGIAITITIFCVTTSFSKVKITGLTKILALPIVAGLIWLGKEPVLRYTVYPLFAGNKFNGRSNLIVDSAEFLATTSMIEQSQRLSEFKGLWTHNFFLDTILQHGYLAGVFSASFFIFLTLNYLLFSRSHPGKVSIPVGICIFTLGCGSMLQPVEFSDGVAFQLSFFVIGMIAKLTELGNGNTATRV